MNCSSLFLKWIIPENFSDIQNKKFSNSFVRIHSNLFPTESIFNYCTSGGSTGGGENWEGNAPPLVLLIAPPPSHFLPSQIFFPCRLVPLYFRIIIVNYLYSYIADYIALFNAIRNIFRSDDFFLVRTVSK